MPFFLDMKLIYELLFKLSFFLQKNQYELIDMRRFSELKTIQSFKIVSFIRSFLFFVWFSKRSLSFQHPNALYRAPLNIISKHTY